MPHGDRGGVVKRRKPPKRYVPGVTDFPAPKPLPISGPPAPGRKAPIAPKGPPPARRMTAQQRKLVGQYEHDPTAPEPKVGIGDVAHAARVAVRAVTGADVNRVIHPVAAIHADERARAKEKREYRRLRGRGVPEVEAGRRAAKAAGIDIASMTFPWPSPQRAIEKAVGVEVPRLVGPALRRALEAAKRSSSIRVPERADAHALIHAIEPDKKAAKVVKDTLDAHAHHAVKGLPVRERKAAASRIFSQATQDIHEVNNPTTLAVKAAESRLAELDAKYEATVAKISEHVNPYMDKTAMKREQLYRNSKKTRRRRPGLGTVSGEVRALAEDRMAELAAQHPEEGFARMMRERQQLRDALNEHALSGEFNLPHEAPAPPETSTPKRLYHVAPKSQRENITREGLQDKLTGKGIFVWDNPEDAAAYHDIVGGDVWEIDPQGLHLKPDPWWDEPGRRERWSGPGQSFVSHDPIPASRMSRAGEEEHAVPAEPVPVAEAPPVEPVTAPAVKVSAPTPVESPVVAEIPLREARLRAAADEVQTWHQENPFTDESLRTTMMKQTAARHGLDEHGLRNFIKTGKVTDATTPVEEVGAAFHSMKTVRGKQEAVYSRIRAEKIQASEAAFERAGGGVAGYKASMSELRGQLPQVHWGRFEHFDEDFVNAAINHIQGHPGLMPFQKRRAQAAIFHAMEGRVPTRSEITLLEKAFPKHTVEAIAASHTTFKQSVEMGIQLLNVPRAIMASLDLSAPFRQGLMFGVRYPRMFFRNFKAMVRAFGSENFYRQTMNEIASRPTFPLMEEMGLPLTDMEAGLSHEEEQMIGHEFAEKITGGKFSFVKASNRAYVVFLNRLRADGFDFLIGKAQKEGLDIYGPSRAALTKHGVTLGHKDEMIGESIARFIGSATGRGDVGVLTDHMATMNVLFFSPRLMASRFNFLSPVYYASLDPFARKEAMKAAVSLVSTLGFILYMAKLGGAKVGNDPRNADFAKVRIGNTRIDMLGGFQQPVRLIAQVYTGTIISSTTGKELRLNTGEFGGLTRKDVIQRFFEAKLAPVPALVNDFFKGTDFADKPFSWKRAVISRMIPLMAQDSWDIYQETGNAGLALAGYGVGMWGIGLQTYKPKPPSNGTSHRGSPYGSSSRSGGSPFGSSPSGGGSPYGR